jgi:hypothetical protein
MPPGCCTGHYDTPMAFGTVPTHSSVAWSRHAVLAVLDEALSLSKTLLTVQAQELYGCPTLCRQADQLRSLEGEAASLEQDD